MHLYTIARGIKHDLDRCIKELTSQYLPMLIGGQQKVVQIAVRPIMLYEIVYPKEHHNLVCSTIFRWGDSRGQHKWYRKFTTILRKMLKIKPLKFIKGNQLPCYNNNIEFIGVGQKDDKTFKDGTEYL